MRKENKYKAVERDYLSINGDFRFNDTLRTV